MLRESYNTSGRDYSAKCSSYVETSFPFSAANKAALLVHLDLDTAEFPATRGGEGVD